MYAGPFRLWQTESTSCAAWSDEAIFFVSFALSAVRSYRHCSSPARDGDEKRAAGRYAWRLTIIGQEYPGVRPPFSWLSTKFKASYIGAVCGRRHIADSKFHLKLGSRIRIHHLAAHYTGMYVPGYIACFSLSGAVLPRDFVGDSVA